MGTGAPTPVVLPIHCAPNKAPCPKCGTYGKRTRKLPPRRVRTVMYKTVAFLEITCGEYRADLLPKDWSSRYESHSRPSGQEDSR